MSSIPIAGVQPILDPWYRYKMPPLQTTVGKANTTVIKNIDQVAKSLHRSPKEIIKFLAIELAVASFHNKKDCNASLKGMHSVKNLQTLLAEYIELCVLCPAPTCGLPETKYVVQGSVIYHDCDACGTATVAIKDHRIAHTIVAAHQTKPTDKKRAKSERKHQATVRAAASVPSVQAVLNDDNDLAWESDTDDTEAIKKSVKSFRRFLKKEWAPGDDPDKAVLELTNRQVAAILPSDDRFTILLQAVLRGKYVSGWKKDIILLCPIIVKLIHSSSEHSRMERKILAVLEYVCRKQPKYFPILALQLYESDVLEEETILQWARDVDAGVRVYPRDVVNDAIRKELRRCSEPLVTWLHEAEEEDGSSDDE